MSEPNPPRGQEMLYALGHVLIALRGLTRAEARVTLLRAEALANCCLGEIAPRVSPLKQMWKRDGVRRG